MKDGAVNSESKTKISKIPIIGELSSERSKYKSNKIKKSMTQSFTGTEEDRKYFTNRGMTPVKPRQSINKKIVDLTQSKL